MPAPKFKVFRTNGIVATTWINLTGLVVADRAQVGKLTITHITGTPKIAALIGPDTASGGHLTYLAPIYAGESHEFTGVVLPAGFGLWVYCDTANQASFTFTCEEVDN